MKTIERISHFASELSQLTGKAVAWLILVLILQLVYDTAARYLFNKPTVWAYDVSYMLYGIIFLIGGAYTLLDDEHIRIEVFYTKFFKTTKSSCRHNRVPYIFFSLFSLSFCTLEYYTLWNHGK